MEEKVLATLNTAATSKHVSPAGSQSMPPIENHSSTPSQYDSVVSLWYNATKNASRPQRSYSPPHSKSFKKPRKKKGAIRR